MRKEDIPVQDQSSEIWQVTEPHGSHRVNSRTVKYQPVESIQAAKCRGFDRIYVTAVEGQATQIRESVERVVGDRVEARHRELDPLCVAGQLVEVAQVAVDARVGDRPIVVGDRRFAAFAVHSAN